MLSGLIHRDIVDDAINECRKRKKRSQLLPAHVVVYYVLALKLFFGEAYEEVMRQLANGLRFLGNWRHDWTVPSASALSQARTRLGEAPLKLLFERIAVPMARAGTRGAWVQGLRVMAIDGLVFDVPDTPANDEAFGRGGNDQANGPFPGGPPRRGGPMRHPRPRRRRARPSGHRRTDPRHSAARPARPRDARLGRSQLLQLSGLAQASATGAALLWRVSGPLPLPVLVALPDGSYRSLLINPKIRGRRREMLLATAAAGEHLEVTQAIFIRVIEYPIEARAGSGELFCLITTITDRQLAPAVELAAAYHQRWEIELSFDKIEIHQTGHTRVLRSRTPELVKQEIWALLLTHYAIRHVMKDAVDTVGTDPDDLSFIRSYRAIRRQVTNQAGFPLKTLTAALTETTHEITERPNPPRRYRTYPRVVKRYRTHRHCLKQATDHGQLHNGPPKIHLFKIPCQT
jgi:hypothetical protein